jgi:hypothetical protein
LTSGIDPSKILAAEPERFQAAEIIAVREGNLNSENEYQFEMD